MQRLLLLSAFLICTVITSQAQQANNCPYIKTSNGYLMVLRQNDDVLAALEKLTTDEKLQSASFTGIGFAGEVIFGFYDFASKKFNPKIYNKVEMGSLTGSIAWKDGRPSLHIHGVATDSAFNAYGGHILSLKVGTGSMEIYINSYTQKLERRTEDPPGANVLQLPCGPGRN